LCISRGQTAPWTSVFNKIHIELGNETWNGVFDGEVMAYPPYPQWANQVFGAARATSGYDPSKFDLVLSGWASNPGYTDGLLLYSTQHDSIDIAPYLVYSANNDTMTNLFQALFAEPEMFNTSGGEVYQNMQVVQSAPTPTKLNVYEVNLGTVLGTITQSELNEYTPSVGAGVGTLNHMLQMMRLGVNVQNMFVLPQYEFDRTDGSTVRLWGAVVDMGTTNLRRPQYLAEQLANTAIFGDMLQTTQSGANPTWNQPLSSDNVQFNGAHEIQSFAFTNGTQSSLVLFNLTVGTSLPVTFSGPNAPTGTVNVGRLTSANITDTNETSNTVQTVNSTVTGFNSSSSFTLPPFSMTVLTWGGGTESTTPAAATPVFSPAAGTYTAPVAVSIGDTTSGATIYYTTNGSTPTTSSTKYTGPVTVSATETLEAMAVASNYSNSAVASSAYTMQMTAATPVFSPAAGTYTAPVSVSISDATSGTTIYYTTNGSTPTTSSTKYSGAIAVSATETLKAIAVVSGDTGSAVASAAYTIQKTAATPVFSQATGTYTAPVSVSISDATSGAAIYYTTNGSTPTTSSTKYSGAIAVSATETLKAIAVVSGDTNSAVASAAYTISIPVAVPAATPAITPGSGTYSQSQTVTITDATAGATIYYTTNGTTPTTSSAVYKSPFTMSVPGTVEAIAVASGHSSSAVASVSYQSAAVAVPTFSPAAGSYTTAQKVTISDATTGTTIYYTTNGATPTTSSTKYTGPIAVSASETLKAIAVRSTSSTGAAATVSTTPSGVASATYTIGGKTLVNFANGFNATGLNLNVDASLAGTALQLTPNAEAQIGSAWYGTPVTASAFTTDFTFQITNAGGDGFTFTLQNDPKKYWASGGNGSAMGLTGITKSVAVLFDFDGASNFSQTTVILNGTSSVSSLADMTGSGINLHNGDVFHAHITYSGTTLTLTLTDTKTGAAFTKAFTVNIPSTVGATTAYAGFTASTGALTATQKILTWSLTTP
jgi:hypothetical protein